MYVFEEITSNRARFPKDVSDYTALAFFGSNILVTEGEEWKKQRKLAAPTFSEVAFSTLRFLRHLTDDQKNNALVWNETVRIIQELFASWGSDKSEVALDHCLDITLPVSMGATWFF